MPDVSLDIGDALDRGFRRTVARNGLLLVAITYVLNVVNGVLGARRPQPMLSENAPFQSPANPLVEVPIVLDGVLSLLVSAATVFVGLAALRVFVGEETETLPEEAFTRNALWAFLNFVAGAVVFGVAVGVGLVLLVVPGLFLLVSLIFWEVFVAVEDDNFVEGFRRSWALTSGNRLSLFGLGVAYVAIALVVGIAVSLPALLFGPFGVFVSAVTNAGLTVFGSAVLASAYRQLTPEDATNADAHGT